MNEFHSVDLQGKRLLYIGNRTFITREEDVRTSMWSTLKKHGLTSLYMVLQSDEGDQCWVKQLSDTGVVDVYSTAGVVRDGDMRPVTERAGDVIEWLKSRELEIDCCLCMGQLLRLVQAEICSRLGLLCDSYTSVRTAVSKYRTQEAVLNSTVAAKHGVMSYSISDRNELQSALNQMNLPVVMKPAYGGGSSGCMLLNSAEECHRHLEDIKRDMVNGGETCQKIAFSQEVVVMEYVNGTKYAVDLAVSRGKLLGGVIAQRGPAPLPYFHATTLSVPGRLLQNKQHRLIQATFDCCKAVGLENGVYDVDMIWQDGGEPKLLEINPRPGGHAINDLSQSVYGIDLFVLNAILACGVPLTEADCANFTPSCHGAAFLPYFQHNGTALRRSAERMVKLKDERGIRMAYPGRMALVDFLKTDQVYLYPPVVICAFDDHSTDAAGNKIRQFLIKARFYENPDESNLIF